MMSQRKLHMVGICLTVKNQAKRTTDTIVETTTSLILTQDTDREPSIYLKSG